MFGEGAEGRIRRVESKGHGKNIPEERKSEMEEALGRQAPLAQDKVIDTGGGGTLRVIASEALGGRALGSGELREFRVQHRRWRTA